MQELNKYFQVESNQNVLTRAQRLLVDVVADQRPRLGGGDMTASVYDTAWVAMVRDPHNRDRLAFPQAFSWLLSRQDADGSWCGPGENALLPTMAALLALLKAPERSDLAQKAASKAIFFLRGFLPHWSVRDHESVGFEVLAPRLMLELENQGISLEFPDKDELMALYHEKLAIAGPEMIYDGRSNLIHSLEAFGEKLDFDRLKQLQAENGSYGCSASATAAVLVYKPEWDEPAYQWLKSVTGRGFDGIRGTVPTAYPIDIFEGAWVLYNLSHGFSIYRSFSPLLLQQLTDWLQTGLNDKGASITRYLGMPTDSDDTGMLIAALNETNEKVDAGALLRFEREAHFACFERERGTSLSANAHVLAAFLSLPAEQQTLFQDSIEKVVDFLFGVSDAEGYWYDKWHLSPFYATACCVKALANHPSRIIRNQLRGTAEWVLEAQSWRDGGWGHDGRSTMEETAYALQILQVLPHLVRPGHYHQAISRGKAFLVNQLKNELDPYCLPKLWRGKELYTPPRVVLSSVYGVLAHTSIND